MACAHAYGQTCKDCGGTRKSGECYVCKILRAEVAQLRADVEQLRAAATAYRDLATCYRTGKRPSEKLHTQLSAAREAIKVETP